MNTKGQILLESVVAITVAVLGLLGMFSLLSRSVNLSKTITDRYIASHFAAEGVEVVKNMIDTNVLGGSPWNRGLNPGEYEVDYDDLAPESNNNRLIFLDAATGRYGYGTGSPTIFKRKIMLATLGGGKEMRVNSVVSWARRGGEFEINVEDHFFDWK